MSQVRHVTLNPSMRTRVSLITRNSADASGQHVLSVPVEEEDEPLYYLATLRHMINHMMLHITCGLLVWCD